MRTSIKFYLATNKTSKSDNTTPIYLRVVHNRKKAEGRINLPSLSSKELNNWHQATERFAAKANNQYNGVLNKISERFASFIHIHEEDLHEFTPHQIRDFLLNKKKGETTSIKDAIERYWATVIALSDKSKGTKRNYRKSFNHLERYIAYKKIQNRSLVSFQKTQANDFVHYLRSEIDEIGKASMTNVSVKTILKNIKPIFGHYLEEEAIKKNPFDGISIKAKSPEKPRLSIGNFQTLNGINLDNHAHIEPYRDIFRFMCYTGLAYSDVYAISRDIASHNYLLDKGRTKTGSLVRQKLIQPAIDILERYHDQLECKVHNTVLPKRSLAKINQSLKQLGVLSGVDFPLSTYAARRFFRQTIYNAGISEPMLVKSLMGHSSAGLMDSHYLLVTEEMLNDAKVKLEEIFISWTLC